MNDKAGLKGSLTILKYKDDELLERYYYENLITNDGLNYLLKLIGNDTAGGINKLALGDGSKAPEKGDKVLANKVFLADVQRDYSVTNRINFLVNIPANTFTKTVNYREAGLVNKTANSETLVTRLVFDDVVYQKPENAISFLYSLELRV